MISRVTAPAMAQSAMRHLQANLAQLARLQEQATSQRAFAVPSDDPAAAATALQVHAQRSAPSSTPATSTTGSPG
ncbi:hypothetical protein [Microbacterium elymi]|uniref:hypothetical protein n=1 Tax=Microbacterium elymi TaxID=2909587 RepID=UPI00338F9755